MTDMDFDEIEGQLDLIVPNIYRMFIDAIDSKDLDLKKYGISYDTESVIEGNLKLRISLSDAEPKWESQYFDIGVGDGCGNYFFLVATDEDDDQVKLWAHDPSGIEDVGTATKFLMSLLSEIEAGFNGPNKCRYQGNGF
ncbi:hypothetical protein [Microbulbifer sp. TRSA005]|uniref:hypothetical protein n=1 Tax=Microbulbifer sp. TRSA005 TaxID=3243383 RepID=UPI00403A7838